MHNAKYVNKAKNGPINKKLKKVYALCALNVCIAAWLQLLLSFLGFLMKYIKYSAPIFDQQLTAATTSQKQSHERQLKMYIRSRRSEFLYAEWT